MSYIGIARKAGTLSSNIEKLVSRGEGSPSLARRIGATSEEVTAFVSGQASPAIAEALGATTASAQALRDAIGMEGAIGLVIGLACGRDGVVAKDPKGES